MFSSDSGLLSASISRSRFEQLPAEDLEKLKKPFVPKNTSKSNKRAVKNFEDWVATCNVSQALLVYVCNLCCYGNKLVTVRRDN